MKKGKKAVKKASTPKKTWKKHVADTWTGIQKKGGSFKEALEEAAKTYKK